VISWTLENWDYRHSQTCRTVIIVSGYKIIHSSCHSEPVGGTAPRFASLASSQEFPVKEDVPFALLCPAQSYPPPLFQ